MDRDTLEPLMILRASICGHHYDKDCISCQGARECSDHELDRLRAEVERLRMALEPFVSGASHTKVFLTSREKMHSAGVALYDEDVSRAIDALSAALEGEKL